jgi:hypothetical protein
MNRRLLAAAVLAVALAACQPPAPVTDVEPGSPMQADTLTADGADRYHVSGDLAEMTATAPETNGGGNTRIAVTVAWTPATHDQAVCATFADASADIDQQGLVLRWNGTTGITVTKGVWASVYTVVNVHRWDTRTNPAFTQIGGFPLTVLGAPGPDAVPLPWRMCAWTGGDTVHFKVWPLAMAEPADDDPCCTGTVDTQVGDGRPGWFAGHLQPGDHLTYTDLTTEVIV